MVEGIQKLAVCLLFCCILLSLGCVSSPPAIMPIGKNNSSTGANYVEYGTGVAQPVPSPVIAAPKNQSALPKLPDIPPLLPPKEVQNNSSQNNSLKLEGIFPRGNLTNLSPIGAVAKVWTGDNESNAGYYPLLPGGTTTLADGTKLELSSFNSDRSRGGVWATYVIGGIRRTAGVGQVSDAGNWNVRTMDLYLPPEKVFASFLLSDFGAQNELNVTLGTSIYPSSHVYEAAGIYSGYTGSYSAVMLTEGQRKYIIEAGEEKSLPLQ